MKLRPGTIVRVKGQDNPGKYEGRVGAIMISKAQSKDYLVAFGNRVSSFYASELETIHH